MGGVSERLGSNPGRRLNEPTAEELSLLEMAYTVLQEISPRLANDPPRYRFDQRLQSELLVASGLVLLAPV